MSNKSMQGEGNREADRRYREGVRKTVEKTTPEERAEMADDMTAQELEEANKAAEKGRSPARS